MPGENYDEEYVKNILAEHANLNLKYGQRFADQSKCSKTITERKKNVSATRAECETNQSQTNEASEILNEMEQNRKTTSGQSEISTLKSWTSLEEARTAPKQEDWYVSEAHYPCRDIETPVRPLNTMNSFRTTQIQQTE